MNYKRQIVTGLKALRELGLQQVGYYALYRFQFRSTYLTWRTRAGLGAAEMQADAYTLAHPLPLLESQRLLQLLGSGGRADLSKRADEILSGKVCLFGGDLVPLVLGPASSDKYWTDLELGNVNESTSDIKLVWEMGRFGWVFTLGRAYRVSGDERYPQAFWEYLETFLNANPPFFGCHWISAQEVALRLMALSFAAQVFYGSVHSTDQRKSLLGRAIAAHAARIPPTISYARAQANNHLLVEAVGLYTAGAVLPNHPQASGWRKSGWRWSNKALLDQISADGSYVQQSTNYHRLMLQAALWLDTLAVPQGDIFSGAVRQRLALATRWLLALLDPDKGQVPNLGPNDGAYILPLSSCSFHDYRPVLQAAWRAFLGERIFGPGLWDEMAEWLPGQSLAGNSDTDTMQSMPLGEQNKSCKPLVLRGPNSWAYLRAAKFSCRPGHADQLHLDLWWRGLNIARDAGTYLYNAAQPWDNALSTTLVHNTVNVNGQDQMTRAGRFLWLNWAQAGEILYEGAEDGSWKRAAAGHNGYRWLGVLHQRVVTSFPDDRWMVEDTLSASGSRAEERISTYVARLHWLLPDWPWSLVQHRSHAKLELETPHGRVSLSLDWHVDQPGESPAHLQLARAGELLAGHGAVSPISGWYSPAYASKLPALSFSVELESILPLVFKSEWILV